MHIGLRARLHPATAKWPPAGRAGSQHLFPQSSPSGEGSTAATPRALRCPRPMLVHTYSAMVSSLGPGDTGAYRAGDPGA